MFTRKNKEKEEADTEKRSRRMNPFRRKKVEKEKEPDDGSFWRIGASTDKSTEADDATETVTSAGSFWKKEKGQKMAVYREWGGNPKETITLESQGDEAPEPKSGYDVVITVEASTVSISDCLIRQGKLSFFDSPSLPVTPGFDVVGQIVSCGSYVTDFKAGDRVAALVRTGGNARFVNVPASSLVSVPRSVDAGEAACMVQTHMTAYQALKIALAKAQENYVEAKEGFDRHALNDKSVLVIGGCGPMGEALIQICKKAGAAKVFATAPADQHTYVRMVLNAKPLPLLDKDWLPLVEGQIDIVFDKVCQGGLESPRKALTDDGFILCTGMSALHNMPSTATWFHGNTATYEAWTSFYNYPQEYKADLEQVFTMLKKGQIKPHIAKRISLNDVADAHSLLEKGKARGAIVCMPWKRGRSLRDKDDKASPDDASRD